MNPVLAYIEALAEKEKTICLFLYYHLVNEHGLKPKLSYRIPFFYGNAWVCYLNPQKKGGVEVCFTRGTELQNASLFLEGKGRKQIMGLTLKDVNDSAIELIIKAVDEALMLDQTVPYQSPAKRKK